MAKSGRYRPVSIDEEKRIKHLYGLIRNVKKVSEGVGRSTWTVRRTLFGHIKQPPAKKDCFNWEDFNNSII